MREECRRQGKKVEPQGFVGSNARPGHSALEEGVKALLPSPRDGSDIIHRTVTRRQRAARASVRPGSFALSSYRTLGRRRLVRFSAFSLTAPGRCRIEPLPPKRQRLSFFSKSRPASIRTDRKPTPPKQRAGITTTPSSTQPQVSGHRLSDRCQRETPPRGAASLDLPRARFCP